MDSGADITRAQPNIDLPELLRYAKSKNVKVGLWAHWTDVNREAFQPRNVHPMVMGTEAYEGQKELRFLSAIPTTWDETRVINAEVGDYITIARRHGKEWYVGSIVGSHAAQLDIPLEISGMKLCGRNCVRCVGCQRVSYVYRHRTENSEPFGTD